jgi:hypothetical protein
VVRSTNSYKWPEMGRSGFNPQYNNTVCSKSDEKAKRLDLAFSYKIQTEGIAADFTSEL